MPKLHEKFSIIAEDRGESFFKDKADRIILDNLRLGSEIRPYQKETFGRFIYYLNEYQARPKGVPTQLLFHMATGSGKTLIMAGLIVYLYNKGYRNFLFFVNSTNIIEKTRDNFLNPNSSIAWLISFGSQESPLSNCLGTVFDKNFAVRKIHNTKSVRFSANIRSYFGIYQSHACPKVKTYSKFGISIKI